MKYLIIADMTVNPDYAVEAISHLGVKDEEVYVFCSEVYDDLVVVGRLLATLIGATVLDVPSDKMSIFSGEIDEMLSPIINEGVPYAKITYKDGKIVSKKIYAMGVSISVEGDN